MLDISTIEIKIKKGRTIKVTFKNICENTRKAKIRNIYIDLQSVNMIKIVLVDIFQLFYIICFGIHRVYSTRRESPTASPFNS